MSLDRIEVRNGLVADLGMVAEIQSLAPDAAHWHPQDYLACDFRVAVRQQRVIGFLVTRRIAEAESEILSLAVHADFQRKGVARQLLQDFLMGNPGRVHLEVRDSNAAALKLYKTIGFEEVGVRREYYQNPPANAIVMTLVSCYCHSRRQAIPAALQKMSK